MAPSVLYSPCERYYQLQHHHIPRTNPTIAYQHCVGLLPTQPYHTPAYLPYSNCYYPYFPAMAASNSSDMDDFQRLSDQYHADLPGPLIGEKLPMSVLATEYAQADPTYVVKTAALAKSYSGYRNIKGDGQCGWRATVFGYFETLLQLGDLDIIQEERVRLQTFEDTMRMAGLDYDLLVDMFETTWELFDELQRTVERQSKDETTILEILNDENRSNSIVYHFKMMTGAFMTLRSERYEPFLEMPVPEYRVMRIDPANQEIDQIGLQALTDAVIAPANFAIEVLYLDRSMGEEVTPHLLVADPVGKPTIRLLYRPGHYDMIYKDESSSQQSSSVQVFFHKHSMIPSDIKMADPNEVSSDLQAYLFSDPQSSQSQNQNNTHYSASQRPCLQGTPQWAFQYHPPSYQAPSAAPYDFSPRCQPHHQSPYSSDTPSPQHPVTPSLPASLTLPLLVKKKAANEPQIRLSANCIGYGARHESVPLCTQTYGSAAALSPAHFRNQEFQPQMWRAEEEYLKL